MTEASPEKEGGAPRMDTLMRMVVRTIRLARTRVEIGLVNLAYNMRRFGWHSRRRMTKADGFRSEKMDWKVK